MHNLHPNIYFKVNFEMSKSKLSSFNELQNITNVIQYSLNIKIYVTTKDTFKSSIT